MLAAVWRRGRLRPLEDRYAIDGAAPTCALEREIIAVSLRHGVLCRFTSFVAVDRTEVVNPGGVVQGIVRAGGATGRDGRRYRQSHTKRCTVGSPGGGSVPRKAAPHLVPPWNMCLLEQRRPRKRELSSGALLQLVMNRTKRKYGAADPLPAPGFFARIPVPSFCRGKKKATTEQGDRAPPRLN